MRAKPDARLMHDHRGKDATIAILRALVARATNGMGRNLSISLARSAEAALVKVAESALVIGRDASRGGTHTRTSSVMSSSMPRIVRS
jgi:hypothetical protein